MQEYNSIKWTFLKWRLLREAQAVLKLMGGLEVPPVTSLANHCTIAGLDSQTALILEPQHTSINGNISVSPNFGDLFCFYGLVIIYIQAFWKKKTVRSKNLGLSSYTDLRRTLGSCSAEHSGHLPHWQHTEVPASQSSWGRGSFFLAFVPLFQREVSIPLLNAATTEGFIPKIQPPEHWHSYQCSLSNCAALEKVEGRKTPITCQGRHRGPRSDLTANKSYRIIFYQTKQVLNPSVIFGRCLSWQNPREKQRQY